MDQVNSGIIHLVTTTVPVNRADPGLETQGGSEGRMCGLPTLLHPHAAAAEVFNRYKLTWQRAALGGLTQR